MKQVRLGIIGMGNMGGFHADYLLAGKVKRAELTAVCSTSAAKLEKYTSVERFQEAGALLCSGKVDAVIIATPHPQHPAQGVSALEAGLHVMVEKPIASQKADAERLIATAALHPQLAFAAMFQFRVEPRYLKIRDLIQKGELGEVVRVNWIITDWFRTEAYYASGGWRATWKGEGGGVLLNQCLHQLDTLQWLLGMPANVRGFCQIGRYHNIEVEDDVTVFLRWPGGASGVFVSSTGEAPGTNRFEICGTRGKVVLENSRLCFTRNEEDMIQFSRSARTGFAKPGVWNVEIPFENAAAPHSVVLQNFVDAILDGVPLLAPGAEGLHSVELANAMLYSSLLNQTVELPLDGAAFETKLAQLIAASRFEKTVVEVEAEDFSKSFHR